MNNDEQTLKCGKCKDNFTTSMFHKNNAKSRGYSYYCKLCMSIYCRAIKRNGGYWKGYKDENKLKKQAQWAVSWALKTGDLIKLPCHICDNPKSEAHHESYKKEHRLDVLWLCRSHHRERHEALKAIENKEK